MLSLQAHVSQILLYILLVCVSDYFTTLANRWADALRAALILRVRVSDYFTLLLSRIGGQMRYGLPRRQAHAASHDSNEIS
jgi:hypothetical protein